MDTYRLGLYFREIDGPILSRPISHVYVRSPLGYEYPDAENMIFLTPREYGPQGVENEIDKLIEELQTIKQQVRAKYKAYASKINCD